MNNSWTLSSSQRTPRPDPHSITHAFAFAWHIRSQPADYSLRDARLKRSNREGNVPSTSYRNRQQCCARRKVSPLHWQNLHRAHSFSNARPLSRPISTCVAEGPISTFLQLSSPWPLKSFSKTLRCRYSWSRHTPRSPGLLPRSSDAHLPVLPQKQALSLQISP